MPRGRKKNSTKSSMKTTASNSKQAVEKMKYEIANELGVNMGPDATSRTNGAVGGEITKRLVKMGEHQLNKSRGKKQ
jgi:Small, acid-soluble spore proteins, alpha/beta type.